MSKKTGGVAALVGLCSLSLFLVNCGSSSSRPSGLLYVVSQAANNVSSFALDLSSGSLSLISSSAETCAPSTTCGLPLSISLDPTGATALVLNQSSISGYTVGSDGGLSAPTAAATLSEPAQAMTRDAAGDFLFVISAGAVPPAADCSNAVVIDPTCPSIAVYSTSSGSASLTLDSTQLLNRVPTALSAITFTPSGGSATTLLFVTTNQDLTVNHSDNLVSVYAVDSSGNLTEQPNSPYITQVNPTSVIAVNTNPIGQATGGVFVYVGNQGASAGSVSAFQVCTKADGGVCTPQNVTNNFLFSIGTPSSVGQTPSAMLVDPTNSFLYVACTGSNTVFGFRMTTGTGILTALSPASQPTGSQPVALAMHANVKASAQFLYVSNNASSNVTGFTVGATTGAMSNPITVTFTPGAPAGMAAR